MSLALEQSLSQSAQLTALQQRADAPFGMLFLCVTISPIPGPLCEKLTTQTNEETTNDGKSKLDPVYDEDEDDEEIPENY